MSIPDRLDLAPPAGWRRITPDERDALVRRNYGLSDADGGLGAGPGPSNAAPSASAPAALSFAGPAVAGFAPTLTVRLVPSPWPLSEAGRERLRTEQQKLVEPLGGRVLDARLIDVGPRKALRADLRYRPANVETALTVVVYPLRSGSALLTYATRADTEATWRPAIDASIASIVAREAWHTGLFGGRLFTYAVIAIVGTGVLLLLLRRRRARRPA